MYTLQQLIDHYREKEIGITPPTLTNEKKVTRDTLTYLRAFDTTLETLSSISLFQIPPDPEPDKD